LLLGGVLKAIDQAPRSKPGGDFKNIHIQLGSGTIQGLPGDDAAGITHLQPQPM